jgi:hypothetical protein
VTSLARTPATASSQVLTAGTYGRGVWQIPSATAGAAVTTATAIPTSLSFAGQTVATTSAAQTVTLKATGTASLTVSSVAMTGSAAAEFTETDTCVGTALATNATCTLKVSFTPAAAGTRTASLAIQANVTGGQLLVPLTGRAVAGGSITLSPPSLSFATQQVGTTSAGQVIAIQDVGGSQVTLNTLVVTAPFRQLGTTCGGAVNPGTSCAYTVAFAPTQAGAATGSFTVNDSAGTQSAPLTGNGVVAATDTLSTTVLTFASTVVGQTSPPLTVTMTDSGGLPMTGIGTSISSSTGTADFTAVSNCGSQLAAASSCGITVSFSPSIAGAETGTLVISDALRAQSVTVRGSGLKPAVIGLNATAISFGSQQVGVLSAAKTITLSNTGGAPLGQPSFSIVGAAASSFSVGTTTCGASLASGTSCTFQIFFAPVAVGAATATLTAATSTPGVASVSATLSGTGLSPPALMVSPTSLNMGSVLIGDSSALFSVQVTNTGQVAMSQPAFAVSGISGAQLADFALSAPTDIPPCTGPLNPAAVCNIQITFSPSAPGVEGATLTVTASNATPSTATVSLTGSGTSPIFLQSSVTSLNFPSTPVGTTASPLTLTVSNLSGQVGNNLALALTGPYSLVPALTTCAAKLPATSSCVVGVSFTATASGNQPGSLTATVSNLGVLPLVVPLNGTGLAVGGIAPSPSQLTFGSVAVKTASPVQTVTVTNSGAAALTGVVISVTGDFNLVANQCPATLQAAASCTTGVEFTPSITGIRSGTLTVNTNSAGVPPAAVPLIGNGIPAGSMAVNPAVLSFGTEAAGQVSPAQTVTVTNDGATTLPGLTYQVAGDYSLAQNGCGTQLTSGAMCAFTVTFSPSAPGTRIGAVTIQSITTGFTPVVVGLTGTGLPTVQLKVFPPELALGSVAVGSNSAAMQLTVSNPGTGTLLGVSFTTATPFSVGSGSCGATIPAGGNCQAPVTFAPSVGGSQNGSLTVATTSPGVSPVPVALSGTGLAPASLTMSPPTLSFPATAIGTADAGQMVTVTNSGGAPLTGLILATAGASAGDFAISSSSCSGTLAAGASCSAVITFQPSAVGGRQGFLTASSPTQGVINATTVLSGTGLTPAVLGLTPGQLTFAATLVGQVTATQTVTVSNSGGVGITNLQLAVSPGFALDPVHTTCTAVLNGGSSCLAGVVFAPTAPGSVSGALTSSSAQAGGSSLAATTSLTGTGALPPGIQTVPLALVQFGTTGLGQAAAPAQVTVTNAGTLSALTGLTLIVDATGTANGYGLSSNTCGVSLAPGASCTANVTFTPSAYGPLTGTLVAGSSNGGNPVSLQLEGIGFDFRLAVLGSGSASVVQGQPASYTFALTTLGGSTGGSGAIFSLQCGNLPANAFCVFNPPQLGVQPANVTGNVVLGIATGAPGSTAQQRMQQGRGALLLACALLALPLAYTRRKSSMRRLLLLPVMLVGLAAGLTSCAGSGGSTGSGGQSHLGGGTPPGSYTVPVSATANGVVHTSQVTLVVN